MRGKTILLTAVLSAGLAAGAFAAMGPSNYSTNNGETWTVGGVLQVVSGGTLRLDNGTKTATAVSGAATLNKLAGVVTSEALSTAAGGAYTLTVANSRVAVGDQIFASVANGTNTGGGPHVQSVQPGAGTFTITVRNATGAGTALNGTIVVSFMVLKN